MGEATGKISVAVVDDDASLCRSLARLLRASGIDSVCYCSAEDLLGDRNRSHFDCLIFDIQLGGMSGIELHERLAAGSSITPVIFLTAHDEPEWRERAQRIGCAAFLGKSDPADALFAAINQAIRCSSPGGEGSQEGRDREEDLQDHRPVKE